MRRNTTSERKRRASQRTGWRRRGAIMPRTWERNTAPGTAASRAAARERIAHPENTHVRRVSVEEARLQLSPNIRWPGVADTWRRAQNRRGGCLWWIRPDLRARVGRDSAGGIVLQIRLNEAHVTAHGTRSQAWKWRRVATTATTLDEAASHALFLAPLTRRGAQHVYGARVLAMSLVDLKEAAE